MLRLLLPDADVVIDLHELGLWDRLIKCCDLYMAGTVLGEVTHYWKNGEKIPIDLTPLVSSEKIIELNAPLEIQSEILKKLKDNGLDGIDPGELESIAIISMGKIDGLRFCIKERLAIKAVAFLGLRNNAISVEEGLEIMNVNLGKIRLPGLLLRKRFDNIVLEGTFIQVEKQKPASANPKK